MGNRAVITLKSMPDTGIYLHWNGGPESVLAFLKAAQLRGARNPGGDNTYAFAGLASTIGLFMHEGTELLSFGIGPTKSLDCDNYDNGQYIVADDWSIAERKYTTDSQMAVSDLHPAQVEYYNAIIAQILERAGILPESAERELDQSDYDLNEILAEIARPAV